MTEWNSRFLASTRGLVISALRRGEASVSELAVALGVTDNTVRAHLATLADKASKLGWSRGVRTHAQKPDAFSKIPAAPKAAA